MIASARVPGMSLREKAAQVVVADFRFDRPDFERVTRLARAGVGGVILFGGSIFDVGPFVNSLQRIARVPLLVAADYEHGVGHQVSGATVLPTNMAVGAAGSEELAELKGRITAREAKAVGVPWILAPVVDLQSNPRNPIVNVRAFGESPELVTRMARAFIRGVHAGGALACLKHFPGHGDVDQDSHLVMPRIGRDAASLRGREIRPFADLLSEADSVMTAHLLVEAFDRERPASLSRSVTSGLLREELGYDGLICTDALMMGGATEGLGLGEIALRALAAGADVLLYPEDPWEAIDAIVKAVEGGRLEEGVLNRAIVRLWAAKQKAGLVESAMVDVAAIEGILGSAEHRAAAGRIAEAAITCAFDRSKTLPLQGPVRLASVRDDSVQGDLKVFERELVRRGRIGDRAAVGVLAVFSKTKAFSGRSGPDPSLFEEARRTLGAVKGLVVVSFGNPYVIGSFPEASACVCAYGESEEAQIAAARAVCGEIAFKGRLPVTFP